MPFFEAWFTRCSTESDERLVAVRSPPVVVLRGMLNMNEQDWLRVSLALRSIELPLVFLEYPLRSRNTFRPAFGPRTRSEVHARCVAGRRIRPVYVP